MGVGLMRGVEIKMGAGGDWGTGGKRLVPLHPLSGVVDLQCGPQQPRSVSDSPYSGDCFRLQKSSFFPSAFFGSNHEKHYWLSFAHVLFG